MPLTLFEIETGPTWWVAAKDADEAKALWVASMTAEGLGPEEIEQEVEDYSITATEYRSRPLTLKGDGEPDQDMWDVLDEMARLEKSDVLACSEYP